MVRLPRAAALVGCLTLVACAGALVRPSVTPSALRPEALLILPGLGYSRDGEEALRSLAPAMAAQGFDLFVPTYLARGGLADSRDRLERFIRTEGLDRYGRLHVFAFLAGAWTFNPLAERLELPNLATVVYDRSPYQERAPRIADEALHFRTWLRYGSPVFDIARTPYRPLDRPDVQVGLVVETKPTRFIAGHEALARSYGPFRFDCHAFAQRYEDCIYVALDHDQLYSRFADVWPEWLMFIREGRFTVEANRTVPSDDPLGAISR
jgi:hypothetical protein